VDAGDRVVGRAGSGHRVIVVDDCVDTAELMAELLGYYGHECRVVHTGADALVAFRELSPTLAFVDLSLPDVDGCSLARVLRTGMSVISPYLVALTGWGRASDRVRTHEAGFDRHVTKPIELATLHEILETADRRAAA